MKARMLGTANGVEGDSEGHISIFGQAQRAIASAVNI